MSQPILIVGSVAFDDVETPAGRRERSLGGSAQYFGVGASFFTPIQLVAVVGQDFPDEQIEFLKDNDRVYKSIVHEREPIYMRV